MGENSDFVAEKLLVVGGVVAETVEGEVAELPGGMAAEVAETVELNSWRAELIAAEENWVA